MDTTTTEHIRASGDELGRTVVDVTQALPLLTDAEIDTLGRACANESIRRKIASARELRLFIALGGGQC